MSSLYLAPATIIPLAVIAGGRLLRPTTRAAGVRLLAAIGLSSCVLVLAYSGYLLVRIENPSLSAQSAWTYPANQPTMGHGPYGLRPAFLVAIAAPAVWLLIAAGGMYRALARSATRVPRAAWQHALIWTPIGLFVSQRPVVGLPGTVLRWPLALVDRWTPFYEVIRAPERLATAAFVGLVLLAGLGFAELAARLRRRTIVWLLVAAVTAPMYFGLPLAPPPFRVASLHVRYPTAPAIPSDSPIVSALRRSSGPLVELPATSGARARAVVPAAGVGVVAGPSLVATFAPPGCVDEGHACRRRSSARWSRFWDDASIRP